MNQQTPVTTTTSSSSSTSSSLIVLASTSTSPSSIFTSASSAPTTTSPPQLKLRFPARIWNSVIPETSPALFRRSTWAKKPPKRLRDEMQDSAPATKKKCAKGVKTKKQEKKPLKGGSSSKATISRDNPPLAKNSEATISGDGGEETGPPVEREFSGEKEDGDENEDENEDDEDDEDDDDWTPPPTPPPPPPSQLERDAIMALMNMQRQRDREARGETHGFVWESLNDWFFDSGEYLRYL